MNHTLGDFFRYNAWATNLVLDYCEKLSDEQLDSAVGGTFGTINETLNHIINAEAGYLRRLTGEGPSWDNSRVENQTVFPSIDEYRERTNENAGRWQELLSTEFDNARALEVSREDGLTYLIPAGVILIQALHHANEHRTQVCTTLTQIGAECPELGVWEFAEDTNWTTVKPG